MILADITTYRGQCSDAEHYYCKYTIVSEDYVPKPEVSIYINTEELKRTINYQSEANELNEKDSCKSWRIGNETVRFDTIEDIHKLLINKFNNHTIVTYEDGKIFKDMLYYKDGINIGYKTFGEVWSPIYTSVYKDLLPESFTIKCDSCGKEYSLSEVSTEVKLSNDRILIKFFRNPIQMKKLCCIHWDLIWNVVL